MSGFVGFDNSTSKKNLNKLETVYLRLWKIEVEGVTVVKFRVNNGCDDGTGCFEIKIRTNAKKLTNMRIARFGQCRDLVRKSKMFVENKADCEQSGRYYVKCCVF